MAIQPKVLGSADLSSTLTTIYTCPTGTIAKVAQANFANGATAGTINLVLEDNQSTPVSRYLFNGYPIAAHNLPLALRDLIIPTGWKLKASASTATPDLIIFGSENTSPPTNPSYGVLATATASISPTTVYTAPSGKIGAHRHIVFCNGATAGSVTLQHYDASASSTLYLLNAVPMAANSILEEFDIVLEAGDTLQLSGTSTTIDMLSFGFEATA